MEQRLQPPEKFYITTLDQYLSLLNADSVKDCFSGLQYLSGKNSFKDRIIVVRANVAEQIRARYNVTKRAFYGANRDIEFTSQTTLDTENNGR
jgi:hypothetical protein